MTEQRYGYTYHRVLIDSVRVLDPQFDDAVIYVTGAQLEMLRNMTQYLRRLSTYVSDYHPGYYLSPTVEDYDDILAIVSDLESVLMGNPNTLWGYNDTYAETFFDLDAPAGDYSLIAATVPEGEVWRITGASAIMYSASCYDTRLYAYTDAKNLIIDNLKGASSGEVTPFRCDVVIKEGDHVYMRFYGLTLNDNVFAYFWGYKMVVP